MADRHIDSPLPIPIPQAADGYEYVVDNRESVQNAAPPASCSPILTPKIALASQAIVENTNFVMPGDANGMAVVHTERNRSLTAGSSSSETRL